MYHSFFLQTNNHINTHASMYIKHRDTNDTSTSPSNRSARCPQSHIEDRHYSNAYIVAAVAVAVVVVAVVLMMTSFRIHSMTPPPTDSVVGAVEISDAGVVAVEIHHRGEEAQQSTAEKTSTSLPPHPPHHHRYRYRHHHHHHAKEHSQGRAGSCCCWCCSLQKGIGVGVGGVGTAVVDHTHTSQAL